MMKRILMISTLAAVMAGPAPAQSLRDVFPDDKQAGILPAETILALARDAVDGTITEIELERKRGVWIYEVEVVAPNGQKYELMFDASSGRMLSRKRERH